MTQRQIGFVLIGIGSVVALIGIVLLIQSGSDSEDQSTADSPATTAPSATTSTVAATTTSTTLPPTTTSTTTTSTTTTSTSTTTTSTTTTSTTTTIVFDPSVEVEAFVVEFAAATASDDLTFLLSRLHPLAVQSSDQATCDAFVGREITPLDQYRTTGPVETTTLSLTVAGETVTVDPAYVVPVAFSISGQSFTSNAQFAPVDGVLHYFAGCR
jgi:cytoskeletal protein RodZ